MNQPLVEVRLVGVPVDLHRRASDHVQTLQRELALVRAGEQAEAGVRLRALSSELQGRFGSFTARQEALLAEAEGTIDVTYLLPADVADAAERMGTMLDRLDELCRAGELVTLVTSPDALAYRRWYLEEFVAQIRDRRPPRPWSAVPVPVPPAPPAPTAGVDAWSALVVDGDLDLLSAPALRTAIAARLEAGARSLVVDLSRCGFVDSVGLSLLLTTRERFRAAGGTLRVVGARDVVLRLFDTVGVRELLVSASPGQAS